MLAVLLFAIPSLHAWGAEKPTCAVLPLKAIGSNNVELAENLAECVFNAIFQCDRYHMIERTQIERTLKEHQISTIVADSSGIEVGKLLGAQFVVIGSVGQVGKLTILNSRIVSVESGEIVAKAADNYEGPVEGMLRVAETNALQLLGISQPVSSRIEQQQAPATNVPSTGMWIMRENVQAEPAATEARKKAADEARQAEEQKERDERRAQWENERWNGLQKDLNLTDDQRQQLQLASSNVRQIIRDTLDKMRANGQDPDPAAIKLATERLRNEYAATLALILSPEQIEDYRKQPANMLRMMDEMASGGHVHGMGMASGRGGGPAVAKDKESGATADAGKVHEVAKGELFGTIAKKYGVTVSALTKANPDVDASRLKVGQKIKIP